MISQRFATPTSDRSTREVADSFVASGNAYSYVSGTDKGELFFNEATNTSATIYDGEIHVSHVNSSSGRLRGLAR
jgi:hypothetical protein